MKVENVYFNKGKEAKAVIPAVLDGKNAELEIRTYKYSGQLIALASVATITDYGNGIQGKIFRIPGDYSKRVVVEPNSRITKKKVIEVQEKVTQPEVVDGIIEDVKVFYENAGESFETAA